MRLPGATLSRPCIAAVATFALGASSAGVATAHTSGPTVRPRLEVRLLTTHGHAVTVAVWTSRGSLRDVSLTLRRNGDVVAHRHLTRLTPRHRTVDFTVTDTSGTLTVIARAEEYHRAPTAHTTSTTSS